MLRTQTFVVTALILFFVGLAALTAFLVNRPIELRVAVPGQGPLDRRMATVFADMLKAEKAPVRLKIVEVAGSAAAATELDAGRVQFAVVRSDVAMPERAQAVAVLRREAVILVAPRRARINRVADLKGKTISLTRNTPANVGLLNALLDHNAVARTAVRVTALEQANLASALRSRSIDAALLIGGVGSRTLSDTIRELPRDGPEALVFIAVDDAAGIVARNPQIESIEVAKGVFGGSPPRPPEDFTTVGFLVRLVARTTVDDGAVAMLVRHLLARRASLIAQMPGGGQIELPDMEASGALAPHPGVRAYVDNTERTFFDRYGDAMYLVPMVAGLLGSLVVTALSLVSSRDRRAGADELRRCEALCDRIAAATSPADVDAAGQDIDQFSRAVMRHAADGNLNPAELATASLMLDQLRIRLADRRAAVEGVSERIAAGSTSPADASPSPAEELTPGAAV